MGDILLIAFYALRFYFYLMLIKIILSWTPLVNTTFYQALDRICEPYLGMFRGWFVFGNIDFTPMVGLLLYQWLLSLMQNAIF